MSTLEELGVSSHKPLGFWDPDDCPSDCDNPADYDCNSDDCVDCVPGDCGGNDCTSTDYP